MEDSTSAWHATIRGSIPGPGMIYFRCINLVLSIRDCVFLVGRGSCSWSAASKLRQVNLPHVACVFRM